MTESQSPPIPEQLSPESSKRRLIAFGLIVLIVFGGSLVSGYLMRGQLLEWAGPLHVRIVNNTEKKYRLDTLTLTDTVTLELDPEDSSLLRFQPSEPTPLEFRLFLDGQPQEIVTHGLYQPHEDYLVEVTLFGDGEIQIQDSYR